MHIRRQPGTRGDFFGRHACMWWGITMLALTPFALTPLAAQHPAVADSRPAASATDAVTLLAKPITVAFDHKTIAEAVDIIGAAAGVHVQYRSAMVNEYRTPVSLHAKNVSLRDALERVVRETNIHVVALPGGIVALDDAETVATTVAVKGGIVGRIEDAKTKMPLKGVAISLDGALKGVVTGSDGSYRFPGVSSGSHTVTAKILGYIRQVRTVTVGDDGDVRVDMQLAPSPNQLDQVIVTGTVIPTERKAVPNAMTVITAKELEQRGITHIDQLFRGDVPGLFAQNQGSAGVQPGHVAMSSRGSTYLPNQFPPKDALTQPIKTYVDGVELADPSYLGLIDPRSIDRIEILTGPQASTIYGSNAINGVMQIFTKRGASPRPQVTATLQSGLIQNNFSSAMTPQHDYTAQVSGLEGHLSYNAGGSWTYIGPWTPAVHSAATSGFGGVRFEQGALTADVSLRRTQATNWQGGESSEAFNVGQSTGTYAQQKGTRIPVPQTQVSGTQTLGVTLAYAPVPWWSHSVTAGTDVTDANSTQTARKYARTYDTLLSVNETRTSRTSLAYTTTVRAPLTSVAALVVTAGADGWHTLSSSLSASPTSLTGTLNAASYAIFRQPAHDNGAFLQGQLGLNDALFLTYGLRGEWNPNYGRSANPNIVPRYGVAYTATVGPVTAKLRGSYGRSTRPPTVDEPVSRSLLDLQYLDAIGIYGNIDSQLGNPTLLPEQQAGGEGGLELYLGSVASLVVTRYNQTVDNLIASAYVDSVRSPLPASAYGGYPVPSWVDGYLYYVQNEYLNLGSIRNQGWELQGTVNTGRITTKATYSWTKSRIIGITPKYRTQFPQYVPGGVFQFVPEHTYALSMQYTTAATTLSFDVQGQGLLYLDRYAGDPLANLVDQTRLRSLAPVFSLPFTYVSRGPGYATADVNASRRLSAHLDGVLQIQNLANSYKNDVSGYNAAIGRQTKVGLHVRW